MRLYSCKVRLSGSLYNEVNKNDVTAAEAHILRILHGHDAIIGLTDTGIAMSLTGAPGTKPVARGQSEERSRLEEQYGLGLVAAQKAKHPAEAIAAVFGVAGQLPTSLPEVPKAGKKPVPVAPAPEPEPEDEEVDELVDAEE